MSFSELITKTHKQSFAHVAELHWTPLFCIFAISRGLVKKQIRSKS